jgi:putative intracellular protease/amidase
VIPENVHLNIGSLLFENLDQIDLTGPYEVLSNIPNGTHRIYAKSTQPVRDVMGLRIMPDATLAEAPQLDILHIPGGPGQQALMEDEEILGWLRSQAAGAKKVLSVCTGALICGAAGLIRDKRATTHWASFHLLPGLARSRWTSGSWSTVIGSSRPALRRELTAPCGSSPRCAASPPPSASSSTSPMRQNRPFRAGRPARRPARLWKRLVEMWPSWLRGAKRPRGGSPPGLASLSP